MKLSICFNRRAGRPRSAGLACIASLLLATLAVADPSADPQTVSPRQGPDRARDDVRLPTGEQILRNEYLRNALSRSHAGLQATRGPNGELTIDLQGRFQSVATARITADGEIETACLENHDSLEHFLAAHPDGGEPDHRRDRHSAEAGHED